MKKKILCYFVFISLIVLALTVALSGLIYRKSFSKQVEGDLERSASVIALHVDGTDSHVLDETDNDRYSYLQACSSKGLRITLISSDGDVLFESNEMAEPENHLDRPEISEAINSGSGYLNRVSASLGYDTYYYAKRLNDGRILRVAIQASGLYLSYNRGILLILGLGVCVFLLSLVLSRILTKKLVAPIEDFGRHIDENDISAPYSELDPFAAYVKHSRDSAREVEKFRREFTANVSHELKTPLTSISGYAEMIGAGIAKKEDVPNFARKIHFEASRLLTLIADIIQLSELDSLTSKDDFEDVDLLEVSINAESYLSMSAEQNGIDLKVCGEPLIVNGCRSRLEELVYNLCDNAIRYNRPGGSVFVSVSRINDAPAVTVKDTGIGIPEDKKERIFERFYRVDKSRSKKSGGTGLGLAIVKHIAMHHDAEIRVESKLGEGTEISVLFKE
ncbi:MAG: two-component sensor histidine kinase [Christensenellaceae bacterium]|nr:two-component sensor histidine kinase [Christensenellaceae bacterium]